MSSNIPNLVSVIMPVFNTEKYVRQAIESVLEQTYDNWELIIVDDGSTDSSSKIISDYASAHPKIKLIKQINKGLAEARNTGIRHATGEFVALLDSDDEWLPTKLSLHVAHLINNPNVGVSFDFSQFINEKGEVLDSYITWADKPITTEDLLIFNPIGNGSSSVIRRQALSDISRWDNKLREYVYFSPELRQSEDIECWVRIKSLTKWEFKVLPVVLTNYRVNSQSLSSNILKQYQSWKQAINIIGSYNTLLLFDNLSLARANHLRYLAKQSVRFGQPNLACKFIAQAIASDLKIITKQPKTFLFTLAAVFLSSVLKPEDYKKIESRITKVTGAIHKKLAVNNKSQVSPLSHEEVNKV
jgi:glycosyltransferase involved in cell wall biosynthesis